MTLKRMASSCQVCQLSRTVNPRELAYHPLETTHAPLEIAYMDIIGPVMGIRSEHWYILTIIDGFSRLLATRPLKNRRAPTVVTAAHKIFSQEMGYPGRVIVDCGSEFVAIETRAMLETQLGVKMTFIPGSEHQQNLVE